MIDITYRDASYRGHAYGKRVRRVEASCGSLTAYGANRTEAKAALLADVARQLEYAYRRRYLRTDDVTFALHYANGWGYDIVAGDGRRVSSTLLGGDVGEHEAFESMRHHFEQYATGREHARGVDRTNGELDAAITAWNADQSDENRKRLEAAERAHMDALYAEQAA